MSFGFGVGDFIAVGKLIIDITSCLKDIGGAKNEFQDLISELDCLQKALAHIQRLQHPDNNSSPGRAGSIQCAALTCQRPLEEFLAKLKKYEPSLAKQPTGPLWKAPLDRIRFRFGHADEIRNLQGFLSVLVGTINILLAEQGLEAMQLDRETSAADREKVKEQLQTTGGLIQRLQSSLAKQARAIMGVQALLESMYRIVSGEITTSLATMKQAVVRAW